MIYITGDCHADFIVTHCCSSSTQALYSGGMFKPDILTDYLETVRQIATFKKWFLDITMTIETLMKKRFFCMNR